VRPWKRWFVGTSNTYARRRAIARAEIESTVIVSVDEPDVEYNALTPDNLNPTVDQVGALGTVCLEHGLNA
jgi:hypothetical protein